jgi:hypothetical protein
MQVSVAILVNILSCHSWILMGFNYDMQIFQGFGNLGEWVRDSTRK